MNKMSMRVLITGCSGMLGSDLVPILAQKFDVHATDVGELDITDRKNVIGVICSGGFDWVLHMAALTDLDWCEEHPEETMRVNAGGTENIAIACSKAGCKMAYISTSGIFSGQLGRPYTEDDIPKPANVYGESKYRGELIMRRILPDDRILILRVGWLFGGGENDKKFVGKMFRLMSKMDRVKVVSDIWGSPNYSVDIANLISAMLSRGASGLFHIANFGEPASRYDVAVEIRDAAGFTTEIEAVPSSAFPTKALRPPMEAITSTRLEKAGFSMRHWKEALREYIRNRLVKMAIGEK